MLDMIEDLENGVVEAKGKSELLTKRTPVEPIATQIERPEPIASVTNAANVGSLDGILKKM